MNDRTASKRVLLRDLFQQRRDLAREIERATRRQYPIDCHVAWEHGRHMRSGYVVRHGYNTRVKVRSHTGAEIWIDAERFTGDGRTA